MPHGFQKPACNNTWCAAARCTSIEVFDKSALGLLHDCLVGTATTECFTAAYTTLCAACTSQAGCSVDTHDTCLTAGNTSKLACTTVRPPALETRTFDLIRPAYACLRYA